MLSVRLPGELEKKVKQIATTEGRTKTEIIRTALEAYVKSKPNQSPPITLAKICLEGMDQAMVTYENGYKIKVKERIRAKRTNTQAR